MHTHAPPHTHACTPDVGVVTAVPASQVPAHWLSQYVDVLVLPCRGVRPEADRRSGGDLDGDYFLVSAYEPLLPPVVVVDPAEQQGSAGWATREEGGMQQQQRRQQQIESPLARAHTLADGWSTLFLLQAALLQPGYQATQPATTAATACHEHVQEAVGPCGSLRCLSEGGVRTDAARFFCEYIASNLLGRIANAHLARADSEASGCFSDVCLLLAVAHFAEVDLPKTNKHAQLGKDWLPERCAGCAGRGRACCGLACLWLVRVGCLDRGSEIVDRV